jgi:hypothetical protein
MFDQVEIDLQNRDENFLRSLATSQEFQKATKLDPDWNPVSMFWNSQPHAQMLSILVKVLPAGEQKHIAVNGTLIL